MIIFILKHFGKMRQGFSCIDSRRFKKMNVEMTFKSLKSKVTHCPWFSETETKIYVLTSRVEPATFGLRGGRSTTAPQSRVVVSSIRHPRASALVVFALSYSSDHRICVIRSTQNILKPYLKSSYICYVKFLKTSENIVWVRQTSSLYR